MSKANFTDEMMNLVREEDENIQQDVELNIDPVVDPVVNPVVEPVSFSEPKPQPLIKSIIGRPTNASKDVFRKTVTMRIDTQLHKKIKLIAVEEEIEMSTLVENAIEEYLRKHHPNIF